MILASVSSSESLLSWGWPIAAAIGGLIVFVGLLLEKIAEWKNGKYSPPFLKPHKFLGEFGWVVLMIGIAAEIGIGFALAWKDEKDINAAKNAALNAPISDMSATVIFFVKGTQINELTNLDNEVSKQVGTMYLINKKGEMGSAYDFLTADNFVRKAGFIFGEPNARDNRRYDLRFHSEIWDVFMGVEQPVKAIAGVHWIRVDVNFLPNGAKISDGGIDLVVNNAHKLFHIFPQCDTNMPDGTIQNGTQIFPYRIFATNVDDAPFP